MPARNRLGQALIGFVDELPLCAQVLNVAIPSQAFGAASAGSRRSRTCAARDRTLTSTLRYVAVPNVCLLTEPPRSLSLDAVGTKLHPCVTSQSKACGGCRKLPSGRSAAR